MSSSLAGKVALNKLESYQQSYQQSYQNGNAQSTPTGKKQGPIIDQVATSGVAFPKTAFSGAVSKRSVVSSYTVTPQAPKEQTPVQVKELQVVKISSEQLNTEHTRKERLKLLKSPKVDHKIATKIGR